MKICKNSKLHLSAGILAFGIAACLPSGATTVVIDDHFDNGDTSPWQSAGNTRTINSHSITETGTLLTSTLDPIQTNVNRGIASVTSFDPSAESGGFSMTFVVDSVSAQPNTNGFFIGMAAQNADFYRNFDNFGLTFYGNDGRTVSAGGFGLNANDIGAGGPAANEKFANSNAQGDVQAASFLDGFSATMTADTAGWSYDITGLSTAAGTPTTFSDSGTWGTNSFATLFAGDTTWFATYSMQRNVNPDWSVVLDRITVTTIPEPSALAFLGLAGLGLLRRRR